MSDDRAEYIAGLRALADLLEHNPDLMLPFTGGVAAINVIPHSGDEQRQQIAAWAAALPGRKDKDAHDVYFNLEGTIHGLKIQVICHRDEVCERVVVGTREVTKEIPDPDALAAVPKVTVAEIEEDVRWKCRPILRDSADLARSTVDGA